MGCWPGERGHRRSCPADDGAAAFEYASALDAADREAEAIPVYRHALAGAHGEAVRQAMLAALASPGGPDLDYYHRALASYAAQLPADPG